MKNETVQRYFVEGKIKALTESEWGRVSGDLESITDAVVAFRWFQNQQGDTHDFRVVSERVERTTYTRADVDILQKQTASIRAAVESHHYLYPATI